MGRPPNVIQRVVVEDCEIVKVSDALACLKLGLRFATVATRGRGQRLCLLCTQCGRRAFKIYRPVWLAAFACRACHNLSYTSIQKHDARLDQLLKAPDREILRLVNQDRNMTWKLLAIRAGYIRLGVMGKY
jgi:hypothetical protein